MTTDDKEVIDALCVLWKCHLDPEWAHWNREIANRARGTVEDRAERTIACWVEETK